jgi:hypothetical protein
MIAHNKNCQFTTTAVDNLIEELQNRVHELEEEIKACKAKLHAAKENIHSDELLNLERFKNRIYRHIIEQNTNIRLADIVTESPDGIHVHNGVNLFVHNSGNVTGYTGKEIVSLTVNHTPPILRKPIKTSYVHIDLPEPTPEPTSESQPPPKRLTYRSAKKFMPVSTEMVDPSERDMQIDLIDADLQSHIDLLPELDETYKYFDQVFTTLPTIVKYNKTLDDIRTKRCDIFGRLSLDEYRKLILEHIKKMETIFREKKFNDKKITCTITKSLSPLEGRLTSYGEYTTAHLETDEIQRLELVLDINSNREKAYIPWTLEKVQSYLCNYGIVLFPIQQSLRRALLNRYGFPNIIYLPLQKNTEDDPFSFYILECVNKEKRCWKMECRLEDFSSTISSQILPYMVITFRKLYKDVFGDNEFRTSYTTKCQLMECDCEQLLRNILTVGHPREFCNLLRTLIKTDASYSPTKNDKFNLYGDDILQKKRFQEKDEVDMVEIIKLLFDGITSEEAVDFYRSR